MISSKLFLPERRMCRLKRNKNKKAGEKKNEKEREKIGNGLGQKKKLPMRTHQSKIFHIVTWNLYQNVATMWKSSLIATFRER